MTVAALAALLAGCSGDGGQDTADESPEPTPSPSRSALVLDPDDLGEDTEENVAELEDEGIEVDDGSGGGEVDLAAFCAAVVPALTLTDADEIGSQDHVAMFDAALAVAPQDVFANLQQVRDHYDLVVDPADPPSQDPAGFPPFIQSAQRQVQAAVDESC